MEKGLAIGVGGEILERFLKKWMSKEERSERKAKYRSMVDVGEDGRQSRANPSHPPRRGWPVVGGGGHAVRM